MTLIDSGSDEVGKMFVGGLSWKTSTDDLKDYFGKFGEVVDGIVMKNNMTGKSRGFGFVTFQDPSAVSSVISSGPHFLDGKTIDPKACMPRSQNKGRKDNPKLFLGGLSSSTTESDIRSAFSCFGTVVDINIIYDQETKKPRGFGFLSFESEDSVQQACAQRYVDVNGNQIECKPAVSRDLSRGRDGGNRRPMNPGQSDMSWMRGGMMSDTPRYSAGPSQGMPPGKAMGYGGGWGQQQYAPPPNMASYGSANYSSYNPMGSGYESYSAPQVSSAPGASMSGPPASDPYGSAPVYSTYVAGQSSAPPAAAGSYSVQASDPGLGNYSQDYGANKPFFSSGPPVNGGAGDSSYGYGSAQDQSEWYYC